MYIALQHFDLETAIKHRYIENRNTYVQKGRFITNINLYHETLYEIKNKYKIKLHRGGGGGQTKSSGRSEDSIKISGSTTKRRGRGEKRKNNYRSDSN